MLRHLCTILILLLVSTASVAQELPIEEDWRLWTELSLEKELVDDLELGLDIQYRRDENLTSFDRVLFQPALGYKINKRFSADIGYRYSIYPDEIAHRWFAAITYDKGIAKRLDFFYRIKYQEDFEEASLAYRRLRNRVEVEWDIDDCKWNPEFGVELFSAISEHGLYFNRTRLAMSWSRKITKHQDITLSYYRQWDYNEGTPDNSNIFIIGYKIEL